MKRKGSFIAAGIQTISMQRSIKKLKLVNKSKRFNEDFIRILEELKNIMTLQGEPFRAKAYQRAQESIIMFKVDIINPTEQLKSVPGIGTTILEKFNEFIETGTLQVLERERKNPVNILTQVFGIGPKKAKELIEKGVTTIEELRGNPQLLNEKQILGVKYFDAILQRIPREEITIFKGILEKTFQDVDAGGAEFSIVGSYRRGMKTSGDIDVIITNNDDKGNSKNTFDIILDKLIKDKIIVEILSRGKTKSLTIVRVFPDRPDSPVRRADFLYSPSNEYAFALLYFTGSKTFNTFMRQRALDLGFTLNEHSLSKMVNGMKVAKIEGEFTTEESIFKFLGVKYKSPVERTDGRAIELKLETEMEEKIEIPSAKRENGHNKTIKNMQTKTTQTKTIGDQIEKFQKEGISAIKLMTEGELTKLINIANEAYYCDDKPILTDNMYDVLFTFLSKRYPTNKIVVEGHAGCNVETKKNKMTLPFQLWSMDKIKPNTDAITKWTGKYSGPYVVSCKLDGVSGLYTIKNGASKLFTRGNGVIGQDISHLIPFLRLPQFTDVADVADVAELAIRGEFIISKENFKKNYAGTFANPRNFVAGVINQKNADKEKCGNIDFVAYEVIKPELKPSDQMKFMESEIWKGNGGLTVFHWNIEKCKMSNDILSDRLITMRKENKYEIDGLVVVDDKIYERPSKNPEYAFAFKMVISDQIAEAHVTDVLWSPSKDGYMKPRVQIEPIVLGGVTIEFTTGFNAKFIVDNKIGFGAVIRIIRSGDVIPHIESVVIPAEVISLPYDVPYKWNETGVDIIIDNKNDDGVVREKNITGFFKHLEVEGLGTGNIKRMIEAGFDSVPKIIAMKKADFLKVEGFKEKLATKIFNGIQEKVESSTLVNLMAASNIFGRGFGTRRFHEILKQFPEIFNTNSNGEILLCGRVDDIRKIDGFAKKTAERFVEGIPQFIKFMKEAGLQEKLIYDPKKNVTAEDDTKKIFEGKRIVMTGFRDKELMKWIESNGGIMAGSISSNTFVVLVKDKDETTGKADQARKAGILLLTPEEFLKKYKS